MKFVNCTFIIHKNGNKISKQPILKSNSTSFMFNNIFCEMNIKKVIPWGNVGTVLTSSWKCNFSIYLDIQATITLLCLLLVLYVWFLLFIHFSILQPLSWKVMFSGKDCSSHCIQPTGIGLGSFWRGNRCIVPIISVYL